MKQRPRIAAVKKHTWIHKQDSSRTRGVALWTHSHLAAHLTPEEAYKLANRIVDMAERIEAEHE